MKFKNNSQIALKRCSIASLVLLGLAAILLITFTTNNKTAYGGGSFNGGFVQLTGNNRSYFNDWSKDSKSILFNGNYLMPLSGGDAKAMLLPQDDPNLYYSPNGKYIVYTIYGSDKFALWVADADNTPASRQQLQAYDIGFLAGGGIPPKWHWLSDNRFFYETDKYNSSLYSSTPAMIYDPATGQNEKILSDISLPADLYLSPTDDFLLIRQEKRGFLQSISGKVNLPRTDISNALLEGVVPDDSFLSYYNWSPDGHKLIVPVNLRSSKLVTISEDTSPTITVTDIDDKIKTHFAGADVSIGAASWSPDNTKFVCSLYVFPKPNVTPVSNSPQPIIRNEYLALITLADNNIDLKILEKMSETDEKSGKVFFGMAWSPDSKWLAYQKVERIDKGVFSVSGATGVLVNLEAINTSINAITFDMPYTSSGGEMKFSPDGKAIAMSGWRNFYSYNYKVNAPPNPPSNVWVYYLDKTGINQPNINPTLPVPTPFPVGSWN